MCCDECKCLLYLLIYLIKHAVPILTGAAALAAIATLWIQFLKPADVRLMCGKRSIILWYDQEYGDAPVVDVVCTLVNWGAISQAVDRLELTLKNNGKKNVFFDRLFFRHVYVMDQNGKDQNKIVLDAFSHPLVLGKYSEVTKFIGFVGAESFKFEVGEYQLSIVAFEGERQIASDKMSFSINNADAELIRLRPVEIKVKGV